MAFEIDRVRAFKAEGVDRLFVETADDNYITARWCFMQKLNIDFFWLAVHSLEKYLKAILLLNDRSAKTFTDLDGKSKSYGHDITKLYESIQNFSSELLPEKLLKPIQLNIHWWDATPEKFLDRLLQNGSADNRYMLYGYSRMNEDLFMLDQMVFTLRRLCCPLDAYWIGRLTDKNCPTITNREVLKKNPKWGAVDLACKVAKTMKGERGKELQTTLLKYNFPFAPDDYEHGTIWSGYSSANSPLISAIPSLSDFKVEEEKNLELDLCSWLLENVKLPHEIEADIQDVILRLKTPLNP